MGKGRMLFLVVIGLLIAGYGVTMYQNQQSDVRQAIEVEGTVQSIGAELHEGGAAGSGNPSGGAEWEPVVNYTYTYGGQEYTSDSVYPGPEKRFSFEEDAMEVANQYSPGQTTRVYVNQENPSRAFLISEETNLRTYFFMVFGALMTVGGALSLGREIVGGESGD